MLNMTERKIEVRRRGGAYLIVGGIIIIFLAFSYFIPVEVESGANYVIEDSLLGIIIFHNSIVLILYLATALFLILKGKLNFVLR